MRIGAVGYFGYGAASWFEPVLGDPGAPVDGSDQAGFMLFDTVQSLNTTTSIHVKCSAALELGDVLVVVIGDLA